MSIECWSGTGRREMQQAAFRLRSPELIEQVPAARGCIATMQPMRLCGYRIEGAPLPSQTRALRSDP